MSGALTYLRELNMCSMMLRVVLAMMVGGIVGFEREKKGRPAGFRTYMLVAVGATLTVILSQYLDFMLNSRWAAAADTIGIKIFKSVIETMISDDIERNCTNQPIIKHIIVNRNNLIAKASINRRFCLRKVVCFKILIICFNESFIFGSKSSHNISPLYL